MIQCLNVFSFFMFPPFHVCCSERFYGFAHRCYDKLPTHPANSFLCQIIRPEQTEGVTRLVCSLNQHDH